MKTLISKKTKLETKLVAFSILFETFVKVVFDFINFNMFILKR